MIKMNYFRIPDILDEFWGSGSDSINLIDADTEYVIEKKVPGLSKEDITLKMDSGSILIKTVNQSTDSTDSTTYLKKSFDKKPILNERLILPADSQKTGIKAKVQDGILEIHVPKDPSSDIEIS